MGAIDKEGNTYTVGFFQNSVAIGDTVLTSRGRTDAYLLKYSPTGQRLWVRQLGSAGDDTAMRVVLDAAGNAYVFGYLGGTLPLSANVTIVSLFPRLTNYYVVRFSPRGVPQWAQSGGASMGGGLSDFCLDGAGHLFITGVGEPDHMQFGPDGLKPTGIGPYIMRLSAATGEVQFLRTGFTYGPPRGTTTIYYPRIAASPRGEVYLFHTMTTSVIVNGVTLEPTDPNNPTNYALNNGLLVKYSATGTFEWTRVLTSWDGQINAAVADEDNNLYITGHYYKQSRLGAPGAEVTLPAGPVATSNHLYVAKLAPNGAVSWVQPFISTGSATGEGLALDGRGSLAVVGWFTNGLTVGTATLHSTPRGNGFNSRDVVVAACTIQGQISWGQQAGGSADDLGYNAGFGTDGRLHVLGTYERTCSFGPLGLSTALPNARFRATLGATLLHSSTGEARSFGVFPNPATHYVRLRGVPAGRTVEILNTMGQVVRSGLLSLEATVSVQGLPAGTYWVRVAESAEAFRPQAVLVH